MHIDSLHIGMTDYIGIVMTMMVQPISICSYKNEYTTGKACAQLRSIVSGTNVIDHSARKKIVVYLLRNTGFGQVFSERIPELQENKTT